MNAKINSKCSTLFVGGNGRSGTSLISKILLKLGYLTNESAHKFKHEYSPIVYSNLGNNIDTSATLANLVKMNERSSHWFWKSPNDMGSYSKWLYLVRNPKFILVTRNPKGIARSSSKKEGLPESVYYPNIFHAFNSMSEIIKLNPCPILVLSYENLVDNSAYEINDLSSFLDIDNTADYLSEIVRNSITEGYSDLDNNIMITSMEDDIADGLVAFKNTFLPIADERLSMAETLLQSISEIIDYLGIGSDETALKDGLNDYNLDVNGASFSNVLHSYLSVLSRLRSELDDISHHGNTKKTAVFNNSIESFLIDVCNLRVKSQLKLEKL